MLQPCLRKTQALATLKPVRPSFDSNNMLKGFAGRGPEPSAPCRALHSLLLPKVMKQSSGRAVVSWECLLWIPEQDDQVIKDKSRSLFQVLHKALHKLGEEFGQLSYCYLNTYTEQNSFPHAPGLHERHVCACKEGMCVTQKRILSKNDP